MHLTLLTDYALRVLMHLARQPETQYTIAEIAAVHRISTAHLTKVTHRLAQGGWIITARGRGGGMRLALAPEAIPLGAVVRALEPGFALVECFTSTSRCTLTGHCRLTGVFSGALEAFLDHLDGVTLADLLPRPGEPSPHSTPQRAALPLAQLGSRPAS